MRRKMTALLAVMFLACSFPSVSAGECDTPLISVANEGIRFSESVCPYEGGLLISNFSSKAIEPRGDENKGYILYRKNGNTKVLVPADGTLHKPTGMAVKDRHLFVCDVTRLLVFDMDDLAKKPQVVKFPSEDRVVNALAMAGDTLYVSVTDTRRIYSLDISQPDHVDGVLPQRWLDIPGANGLAIYDGVMYIATILNDYRTVRQENVIYCVRNLKQPNAEKFINISGLYDGVALSDDGRTLYLSDWKTASVTAIDVATKNPRVIYEEDGIGPADIAQSGGFLHIPDLPNHRIISIQIGKLERYQ